jgi:hypothetical protein
MWVPQEPHLGPNFLHNLCVEWKMILKSQKIKWLPNGHSPEKVFLAVDLVFPHEALVL